MALALDDPRGFSIPIPQFCDLQQLFSNMNIYLVWIKKNQLQTCTGQDSADLSLSCLECKWRGVSGIPKSFSRFEQWIPKKKDI